MKFTTTANLPKRTSAKVQDKVHLDWSEDVFGGVFIR